MAAVDYDISEIGAMHLSEANIHCVDDAVDKFIEVINYYEEKISDIDRGFAELSKMQLENPIAMDYEAEYNSLNWSRMFNEQVLDALKKDLGSILGRGIEDEVPWD